MTRASLALACAVLGACTTDAVHPAAIRLGDDACAHCRMTLVSIPTAAQIISPGGEPLFFDDLACLSEHLRKAPPSAEAIVFVVDHQAMAWIDFKHAVITRTGAQTPMGSGLVASAGAIAGKGHTQ